MKPHHLALCAALALAACGQAAAPKEETPAAPLSLMEQVQAQAPEMQLVTAYQALAAYQQAHPDSTPRCTAVRATESRGVIPDNVSPDSIYAAYKGAAVYSVNCGELRTMTRMDPREHWLVVYAPGASEVSIVNCASASGSDLCPRQVPTVAAAPGSTPTTPTTP
ncbi:MAG TPA: hypothetical protein VJ748_03190 [Vitreimonas sp.]|jgi:hypothetical protein|nr:hypothetical protein [Vitreimonas sp.]